LGNLKQKIPVLLLKAVGAVYRLFFFVSLLIFGYMSLGIEAIWRGTQFIELEVLVYLRERQKEPTPYGVSILTIVLLPFKLPVFQFKTQCSASNIFRRIAKIT
jgi:hypothetical protein